VRRFLPLFLLAFCLGAAAPMAEAAAVRIVLTAKPIPANLFSQSFLAQVPAAQLTPVRDQVVAPLGTFVRAEGSNGQYTADFTHGTLRVFIHLDAQGKIDGMLPREPAVTGSVGYQVVKHGKDAVAHNADRRRTSNGTTAIATYAPSCKASTICR
jgi:hypothetical protein